MPPARTQRIIAVVALLLVPALARAQNCEDQLIGNRYHCTYTFEGIDDSVFFGCLDFTSGGSSDFTADLFDGALTMGCTCQAGGKVQPGKTKFAQSKKSFLCAGEGELPLAMTGKASASKMKKLQVLIGENYQLMDCEIDPDCN